MGIVGALVIARWSWGLMRDTAEVLLDRADPRLVAAIREQIEGPGDCRITDLHVWRLGPDAHAAIVSVITDAERALLQARLAHVQELAHVTLEIREAAAAT